MSFAEKIARNAALQVGGRAVGTVLGLFTVGIMTRTLGPEGYGGFTTAMTFLQFFGILADFGLTLTMTKVISEHGADEDRMASNVFTLRLVTAAALFSVAPLVALLFPYSAAVRSAIAVASLSYFLMAVSQVLVGVFQKHLASHLSAAAEVAGRAVLLAGVVLAARYYAPGGAEPCATGALLTWFIASIVAGNAVHLAVSLAAVRRFVRLRLAFSMPAWRHVLRESWPIGLSIAFNLVYLKGDVIALSLWRPQAEVGLYGAAYKVLDVVTVVPMIFMGLALPLLTAAWSSGDRAAFDRRMRRSFDALVLLAVPLAVGAFAVSRDLMALVAGADFAAAGPVLSVLMIACATVFLSALYGHAVVAIGLQRPMIWAYAADAAISALLYWLLVPTSGPLAAAWITVFSEAFILVACFAAVARRTRALPGLRAAGVAALGSAAMYAALRAAESMGAGAVGRICLGIAVYGAVVLASGTVTAEARALLGLAPSARTPRPPRASHGS
jgi:O-antigen/teichoic acid export membrane protein